MRAHFAAGDDAQAVVAQGAQLADPLVLAAHARISNANATLMLMLMLMLAHATRYSFVPLSLIWRMSTQRASSAGLEPEKAVTVRALCVFAKTTTCDEVGTTFCRTARPLCSAGPRRTCLSDLTPELEPAASGEVSTAKCGSVASLAVRAAA